MMIVAGLVGIVGFPIAGRLADRSGRRRAGFLLLAGFPLFALAFYQGPGWILPFAWVPIVFTLTGGNTILRALGGELFPTSYRGTSAGWLQLAESAGRSGGLFLVGWGTARGDRHHEHDQRGRVRDAARRDRAARPARDRAARARGDQRGALIRAAGSRAASAGAGAGSSAASRRAAASTKGSAASIAVEGQAGLVAAGREIVGLEQIAEPVVRVGDEHQRTCDARPDPGGHLDAELVGRSEQAQARRAAPPRARSRAGSVSARRQVEQRERRPSRRRPRARRWRGGSKGISANATGASSAGEASSAASTTSAPRRSPSSRALRCCAATSARLRVRSRDAGLLVAERTGHEQGDPAAARLDELARRAGIVGGEAQVVRPQHGGVRREREERRDRLAAGAVDAQHGNARVDRSARVAPVLGERGARGDRDAQGGGRERAVGVLERAAGGVGQRAQHGGVVPAHEDGLGDPRGEVAAGSRVGVGGGDDQAVELERRRRAREWPGAAPASRSGCRA